MRTHPGHSGGFTLLEVMIALAILAVTALGIGSLSGSMIHTASDGRLAAQGAAAADARISNIQVWPDYSTLDSAFVGTENNTPFTGWSRVTTMSQVTSDSNDYKKFTVTVSGPGLTTPVARTVTIASD